MSTPLKKTIPCPSCGKSVPLGALAGLCPACLLAQGMETEHDERQSPNRFEPPPVADIAKLFPQLEIVGLLGAGGMGAVYKARQPALDRVVALKVLPAKGHGQVSFSERFNREARALARLSHPNIVTVHEFGQTGELHFFIMEFVDGANLRELERSKRLSPREALQIIPQICDALQYAHDEGVVHRDIKPENVLVDRKGRVKIADFGLAKILGYDRESARLTVEGQVMGTPHYMAPEQVERPLTVDHRADIYALGVVLYEMLTGDLPLGNFSPPSRKVQVDVRFDEVVLRALENNPDRRYQQASEVKSRVENIAITPPSAGSTGRESSESNKPCLHWAGFSMIEESQGQRIINRKELLKAWGVVFGLLTVSLAPVSMILGHSYLGFIGISGYQSLVFRAGISALLVGAVVCWKLTRPAGVALGSPDKIWWKQFWKRSFFVAFCVAAWAVFQFNWLQPSIKERFQVKRLRAETVAVFSPPTLLSFDELADFDIGHAANFPSAEPGSNPLAGIGENILWAQENGFDAVAGVGKLELLGVTVAEISDEEWDTMTPVQAQARLASNGTQPREISPLNPSRGNSPAYAFRTREGGVGLLRFVQFGRNSLKFVIQLRNLLSPAAAPRLIRARQDSRSGEQVGRLPGDGTVTLLAVRAAGSETWLRPDGRAAAGIAPRFAQDFDRNLSAKNQRGRLWQILLRAGHLPSPNDSLSFDFPGVLDKSHSGGTVVPQSGENPGMLSLKALWPESATNASMRIGVPMGPWHSIGSYEPFSRSFTKTSWGNEPRWNIEMHAAGVGTKGAQITVVFGTGYPPWNLRLVARLNDGSDIEGTIDATVTKEQVTTRTYVFPRIHKLDELQNFQLQAQPLQWLEYSNISLVNSGSRPPG